MKLLATDVTITPDPSTSLPEWPELRHQRKAIVVVDVVESVRLMQANEADVIDRWRRFVNEVRTQVLPVHGGRLVKSLGDGLLLEFDSVQVAIAKAFELHNRIGAYNAGRDAAMQLMLRIGMTVSDVVVDDFDVYGSGVNLAARLTDIARPGELIVSAEVRDALVDGMHFDVEDMGECFLKHLTGPVRAFRVHLPGSAPQPLGCVASNHLAVLAVVPFHSQASMPSPFRLGDALADDIIWALSTLAGIQLISRLSTSALRGVADCVSECQRLLGAKYVLTGDYGLRGEKVQIRYALHRVEGCQLMWQGNCEALASGLFAAGSDAVTRIAAEVGQVIVRQEVQKTREAPIRTLENFTLYVGGVTLMHRMSRHDFDHSRTLFEQLVYRLPRNAAPKAMLAKWHLMRMLQGWSAEIDRDGERARDLARRALDHNPDHAFALATEGYLAAHFGGDLELARRLCDQAVGLDPQDAQGWRMMAGVHCYLGEGPLAESCAERAVSLSPLDPTRFIFDLVLGAAKLASGKYDEAVAWARSSIRRNAMHVSTHRLCVLALSMSGQDEAAANAAGDLLKLNPGFRVGAFARAYPGRDQPHASQYVEALSRAGLPD